MEPSDTSEEAAFHLLMAYTLQLGDPAFLHQYVVDAYAAQTARPDTKAITVVFALIGLYLHLEKSFSGREVQKAHMKLAPRKRKWALPDLQRERGSIRVSDVLATAPGTMRDAFISAWCRTVWDAWSAERNTIVALVEREGLADRHLL